VRPWRGLWWGLALAAAVAAAPARAASGGFTAASESVVAVPDASGVVRVDELVDGMVEGTGALPALRLPLPPGSAGVQAEEVPTGVWFRAVQGAVEVGPVPAARPFRLAFSYVAPEVEGALWLPIGPPTAYLFVLVPHGAWAVHTAGFAPRGEERLGPLVLDAYVTEDPTPGAQVPVLFSRVWRPSWRTIAWVLALGGLGSRVAVAWRRRARALGGTGGAGLSPGAPDRGA
jgi:hypothetical protein